jgi:hypothetical protein
MQLSQCVSTNMQLGSPYTAHWAILLFLVCLGSRIVQLILFVVMQFLSFPSDLICDHIEEDILSQFSVMAAYWLDFA